MLMLSNTVPLKPINVGSAVRGIDQVPQPRFDPTQALHCAPRNHPLGHKYLQGKHSFHHAIALHEEGKDRLHSQELNGSNFWKTLTLFLPGKARAVSAAIVSSEAKYCSIE